MASMSFAHLVAEGRRLQRPTAVLFADGSSSPAARWYERDEAESKATGVRCWMTVDSRRIPGMPEGTEGYLTLSGEANDLGAWVEFSTTWPRRQGTALYAYSAAVLPPLDAVFARGSATVGRWIEDNGGDRRDRYFGKIAWDPAVAAYESLEQSEHPIYGDSDAYAILGGWHLRFPDDDWHDLIDEHLMMFTLRDSEPWIEVWRTAAGIRAIQRVT